MAHINILVQLRNDSVSPIIFGTLSISAAETVSIWDTAGGDYTSAVENLEQVIENISILNENIETGNLVLIANSSDQLSQAAFDQVHEIKNIYKTWENTIEPNKYTKTKEHSITTSTGIIDFSIVENYSLTLTGSGTITLSFPNDDSNYTLLIIQGGSGSNVPIFVSDGDVLFPSGSINIKGTLGSKTLLRIYRRGTDTHIVGSENMVTGSVTLT